LPYGYDLAIVILPLTHAPADGEQHRDDAR